MEQTPETMYLVTGADGKEYGPVNAEELRNWVRQGRANATTRVRIEGTEDSRTLGEFPEFMDLFEAPKYAPGTLMPDVGTEQALQMVQGPAIGLMIVAILGLLAAAASLVMNVLGTGMGAMQARGDEMEQYMHMMSGTMGIVFNVIGLGVGVLTLVASLKMKKLESYGLVMTGTICSMLPCISPCCCIGLPIGIWVLIVLAKPEVKSAFK